MEQPDTITIEVADIDELFADQVDLFVAIEGKSLFTGIEAFKKAQEVRELAEGLIKLGIPEADILLESVQADVSAGLIGKHSSAIYKLRISCRKLEDLADILGVITSQKNTDLSRMVWRYSGIEEFRTRFLEKCLLKSKQKAEKVASFLGVRLLGVRDFNEQLLDPETDIQPFRGLSGPERMTLRAKAVSKEELGLSVSHSKRITLKLTVKYRVSPLEREAQK
jgi:hypothetical protein